MGKRHTGRLAAARLGFVATALAATIGAAGAQSAGGQGAAAGTIDGGGGQVRGSGDQSSQSQTGLDATSSPKGVAGTGLGGTTPAMQSDTSSTSGNGRSVQRPDPNGASNEAERPAAP